MRSIVFITCRFPFPLNKGYKLRAYNQIKSLKEVATDHVIRLSEQPPYAIERKALEKICSSVSNIILPKHRRILGMARTIFKSPPLQKCYFYNAKVHKEIEEKINQLQSDVIHCHLIRTYEYARKINVSLKSIDYMDCFSSGVKKELVWDHVNETIVNNLTKSYQPIRKRTGAFL